MAVGRMQFHRAADGRLGRQTARSHTVRPLTGSHLPEPALDQAWRQQSTEGAQTRTRRGQRQKGRQRVVLRVGDEQVVQLEDGAPIHLPVLGRRFQVSAGAFFQVNLAGAELMVQHVLGHWPGRSVAHALDLYCGVGLFSAFLAPHVPKLTAVESSTPACTDFVVNLHGFDHVALVSGRVEEMLATLDQPVDYVLADPPRAGLGEAVIRQLLRLAPAHLVYVSCDPATLARDARQLVAGGYRLEQATPFDLFPQTYHIESINRFIKVIDKVIDA